MRELSNDVASTRNYCSNNSTNLRKGLYQPHNRNAYSVLDNINSSEHYGEKHQRLRNLIYPRTIRAVQRANYLRELDIPGAKPIRLIPLKGRDNLKISDIEGTSPKRGRVRNVKFDSILNVKDINERQAFRKKDETVITDFCLNFSNPHLERPRWHRNIRPKAERNDYVWGKPSIQKLLCPSWKDYGIPGKQQYSLDFGSRAESQLQLLEPSHAKRRNSQAYEKQRKMLFNRFASNVKDSERNEWNHISALNNNEEKFTRIEAGKLFCTPQKSDYLKKNIEKMYLLL
eukprot:TRINITY_DN13277_c0_g3_i2.p1 TRINITY_DN13277_c0_g3~~TRINITY_DN13277_c0_g3_i2.p1  ORF type:complete len:287 (+),score=7.08 TRINITY_DN13277_c0_g3_i2:94-954(+)